MTVYRAIGKRTVDLLGSAVGLVLCAPALMVLTILVKIDSPGPVLYRSVRLGRRGRRFVMYKFRSMHEGSPPRVNPDGSMLVTKNDDRITRVGRLLRLGFDELPQLWNVLRGDMSLVGPRPDLPYGMDHYEGDEVQRLEVRPGITGLAQVRGRTSIPWKERLSWDVQYVSKYSLALDTRILLETLVLLTRGRSRA